MGCDIHCYAEVKNNGIWKKVGNVFKNRYYVKGKKDKWNTEFADHPYDIRNYNVFAILANVRNDDGRCNPITLPKDLPIFCSDDVRALSDALGGIGHSHSFLTLKELLTCDWKGQKIKYCGYVNQNEYKLFKNTGNVYSWYETTDEQNLKHITKQEMEKRLKNNDFDLDKNYYCKIKWESTYYDIAEYFVDTTIPELQKLGTPDNVRIVFWFDN